MYQLIIFSDPRELSSAVLEPDEQPAIIGVPAIHPTGREGYGFDIPSTNPNGWGAKLTLTARDKVSIIQRGILYLRVPGSANRFPWTPGQTAAFLVDDFYMQDEVVCPEVPPGPEPIPPGETDPLTIIKATYENGDFNLATKEGCGLFTEAACKNLHELNSEAWGHIRKFPPQNEFNGHAVDAIMLLMQSQDTEPGIYDIILSTESPDAEPIFIYKGPPDGPLWYYPPATLTVRDFIQ